MDQSGKAGIGKGQYFLLMGILLAALLIGAAAYASWSSAKDAAGKLGNALGNASAGTFPASIPSLDGNAQDGQTASQAQGGIGANASAQPNGSVVTGSGGEAQVPLAGQNGAAAAQPGQQGPSALPKEVTIDFLYLDSCPHCQAMEPIVAALSSKLPSDRFEVRYWNYASRGMANASAIYAAYSAAGYFRGQVPTFVANGNDSRVGEMSDADLKAWVCSKFSLPKPAAC